MAPKYYTPFLNEFHDQFEYEELDLVWKKKVFDFRDLEIIHDELLEGKLRVKHLDREDIETLDWECKLFDQSYNSGEFIINNKYILIFNLIDSFCIIKHINFPDHVEKNIISIFQGTIKNKSELKKLMVQLGIN